MEVFDTKIRELDETLSSRNEAWTQETRMLGKKYDKLEGKINTVEEKLGELNEFWRREYKKLEITLNSLEDKLGHLKQVWRQEFESMRAEINTIYGLIAKVNDKVDNLERQVTDIGKKFNDLENKVDGIDKKLNDVEKKVDGLDKKVDMILEGIAELNFHRHKKFGNGDLDPIQDVGDMQLKTSKPEESKSPPPSQDGSE
jgi:chromosome segregation ATPase